LKYLDLSHNRIEDLVAFVEATHNSGLENLNLRENSLGGLCHSREDVHWDTLVSIFSGEDVFPTLYTIDLSRNGFNDLEVWPSLSLMTACVDGTS
jgi:hypothetical protein